MMSQECSLLPVFEKFNALKGAVGRDGNFGDYRDSFFQGQPTATQATANYVLYVFAVL